jgi:hypothetical protein
VVAVVVATGYDGAGETVAVLVAAGEVDGTAGCDWPGLVVTVASGIGVTCTDVVGIGVTSTGAEGIGVTCTGADGIGVTCTGACAGVVGTGRADDVGAGAWSPPPEASAIVGTAMPSPPSTTAPATTTSRLRTCCS